MDAAASERETHSRGSDALVIELLVSLLSRRTAPGHGHVILSAAEWDQRLDEELESSEPGPRPEASVRALRNELVHGQFLTTNYDDLLQAVTEVDARTRHVRRAIDGLRSGATETVGSSIPPAVAAVADNFVDQLSAHAHVLDKLDHSEAARLGTRAAEQVVAAARWSQVVGDRLDTSQVTTLLGVTRQALAKRQRAGSLLGLPGDATTWFPTWQFDARAGDVRAEVRDIIGAFRDRLEEVDPYLIASWATTAQDEDLDGETPARWLEAGRDRERLRTAAVRAAARLAR